MRLDAAREVGAHGLHFGSIDCHAGGTGNARRIHHVENAALTGNDGRHAGRMRTAAGTRAREGVTRRKVEQFEPALDRVGGILGADGAGVSRVDEDQAAGLIASPHRARQRVEQRLQGLDVAGQPVVTGGEVYQLGLDAADVAQAQHRAPRHRAPVCLERPAGAGGERHDEATALAAQGVDRVLHALRRRRLQPGAEGKHAFRRRARYDHAGVADDVRLVRAGRPGHQHLRLRQQQGLEAVDFGAQHHGFVLRRGLRQGGGFARAQQDDDGQRGEAEQTECRGGGGNLVVAYRCGGAGKAVDEARAGVRRRAARHGKNQGGEESAPSRTSTQPLARRPDCRRHFRLAPGVRMASAAPRANRKTLPPRGLAPKESRP